VQNDMTKEQIFREVLSNALAYWEKRRLAYNAVLLAIAIAMFFVGQPETTSLLSLSGAVTLLVLAVAANVLYTVAYLPDIALQLSDYRERWLRWRKWLFWSGLVFAALLTFWVTGVGLVSLWLSSTS
jgi:Mn2+/Fe2+ NRAMP family transporter